MFLDIWNHSNTTILFVLWLSVFLPHGVMGWPAVCNCDIPWSYSFVFCDVVLFVLPSLEIISLMKHENWLTLFIQMECHMHDQSIIIELPILYFKRVCCPWKCLYFSKQCKLWLNTAIRLGLHSFPKYLLTNIQDEMVNCILAPKCMSLFVFVVVFLPHSTMV